MLELDDGTTPVMFGPEMATHLLSGGLRRIRELWSTPTSRWATC